MTHECSIFSGRKSLDCVNILYEYRGPILSGLGWEHVNLKNHLAMLELEIRSSTRPPAKSLRRTSPRNCPRPRLNSLTTVYLCLLLSLQSLCSLHGTRSLVVSLRSLSTAMQSLRQTIQNSWASSYAGFAYGPDGPGPRSPRLRGPRTSGAPLCFFDFFVKFHV